VSAIFALDDFPEKWKHYAELNASYVQGGKFTSAEFAKHQAAKYAAACCLCLPERSRLLAKATPSTATSRV
jgi:hypothetical protein